MISCECMSYIYSITKKQFLSATDLIIRQIYLYSSKKKLSCISPSLVIIIQFSLGLFEGSLDAEFSYGNTNPGKQDKKSKENSFMWEELI